MVKHTYSLLLLFSISANSMLAALCERENPAGLAAWWTGDDIYLDAISGIVAQPLPGTGFTADGKVNHAFTFDGSNSGMFAESHQTLDIGAEGDAGSFSVEFWIKPSALVTWDRIVAWRDAAEGTNGVSLYVSHTGVTLGRLNLKIGGFTASSSNSLLANDQWRHIAVTYDQSLGLVTFYRNGIFYSAQTLTDKPLPETSLDLYIGYLQANGTSNWEFFQGTLDELSLYNRALTAEDVSYIYSLGEAGKCPPTANLPPTVWAGPDRFLSTVNDVAFLDGEVADDGLPSGNLSVQWRKISGPGNVLFADAAEAETTATFTEAGIYVLELEADDGMYVSRDRMSVRAGLPCESENPEGLAAWWPWNGVLDETIHGLNTIPRQYGMMFGQGTVSNGLVFDGVRDGLLVEQTPALDIGAEGDAGSFSVEFWIEPSALVTWDRIVAWRDAAENTNGVSLYISHSSFAPGRLNLQIGGFTASSSNSLLANDQWRHIAVTYDQSLGLVTFYRNGIFYSAQTLTDKPLPETSLDFYIGYLQANGTSNWQYFQGTLDELSLYNRALDASEIEAIYHLDAAGKCPIIPPLVADENLAAALRSLLNLEPDEVLRKAHLAGLTGILDLSSLGIVDLSGLQYATGISGLNLSNNLISDIEAISGLFQLNSLDLSGNRLDLDEGSQDVEYLDALIANGVAVNVENQARFTIVLLVGGGGSATVDPDQADYGYGATVTLNAIPDGSNRFAGWTGDIFGTETPRVLSIYSSLQLSASFIEGVPAGSGDGLIVDTYSFSSDPRPTIWDSFTGTGYRTRLVKSSSTTAGTHWLSASPASGSTGNDYFTCRLQGQIEAQYTEDFTFIVKADNEIAVFLNGELIVDNLEQPWDAEYLSPPIALVAGQKYDLEILFREFTGGQFFYMDWQTPTMARQSIPPSQLYSGFGFTGEPTFASPITVTYYESDGSTVIDPEPAGLEFAVGSLPADARVELSTAEGSDTIRYTLDGSEPTASSLIYSNPVVVTANITLRARAYHAENYPGAVFTGIYSIDSTAPILSDLQLPNIDLPSGYSAEDLVVGDASGRIISILAKDDSPIRLVSFILTKGHSPEPGAASAFLGRIEDGEEEEYGEEEDWYRFSVPFNIFNFADGDWTLTIEAEDIFGNVESETHDITIAIAPPPPPELSSPQDLSVFSSGQVLVSGAARRDSRVILEYRLLNAEHEDPAHWQPIDGSEWSLIGDPVAVSSSGAFSATFAFADNVPDQRYQVRAHAQGRPPSLLPSESSESVRFGVDSSVPGAPVNLRADAVVDGKIRISWSAPPGYTGIISGYRIEYRSYDSVGEVWSPWSQIVDVSASTFSYFYDPPGEGPFQFRVRAVRLFSDETPEKISTEADSPPSGSVVPDATPPTISLAYYPTREGQFDAENERFASGLIVIEALASEPLANIPYLAFTPPGGGLPIRVEDLFGSDSHYQGTLAIQEGAPSGDYTAFAVLRDLAGNESRTGGANEPITDGETVTIDTQGPEASLDPLPPSVIEVEGEGGNDTTISSTISFDDDLLLGAPVEVFGIWGDGSELPEGQIDLIEEGDGTYQWELRLAAGQGYDGGTPSSDPVIDRQNVDAATLYLFVRATNTLGNLGVTEIADIFVYFGDLPVPPPPPFDAEALPGGEVALWWQDVPGAARYQLVMFNLDDSSTETRTIERQDPAQTLDYFHLETTLNEGNYLFYVYGQRLDGETYVDGFESAHVEAQVDGTPPPAVDSVELDDLANSVIEISWEAPSLGDLTDIEYYHVYRTPGSSPADVEAAQAGDLIEGNIAPEDIFHDGKFRAYDSQPHSGLAYYVVVTTDAVENASLSEGDPHPSRNIALVPPATVTVTAERGFPPVLSWSPVDVAETYSVYRLVGEHDRVLLEEGGDDPSFTDFTWSSGPRTYIVESVQGEGDAAIRASRDIFFPGRSFDFAAGARLYSGLPAEIGIVREDASNEDAWTGLHRYRLRMRLDDEEEFQLGAFNKDSIAFGAEPAGDSQDVVAELVLTPISPLDFGEQIIYRRTATLPVQERLPVVSLAAGELARGAVASGVEITIGNPSESSITLDLSDDDEENPVLVLKLLDTLGNVLAERMVTAPTNRTVSGGGSVTLKSSDLVVPESAPASAILQAELHRYRSPETNYNFDRSDTPIRSRLAVSTTPLSYTAHITAPLQEEGAATTGATPILITGQATQADGLTPSAAVPVVLGLANGNFRRTFTLIADNQGRFSYSFLPTGSEPGGYYTVWAKHPDLTRTPDESDGIGAFVYQKIVVSPDSFTIRIPRNFEQGTKLALQWPEGLTLEDIEFEVVGFDGNPLSEADQEELGYHVDLPDPVAVPGPGSLTRTPMLVGLPGGSLNEARFLYRVSARIGGYPAEPSVIAEVPVYCFFTEAFGQLSGPSRAIELSALREEGTSTVEDDTVAVRFTNTGLIPLSGVAFDLVQPILDGDEAVIGYRPAPSWIEMVRPSKAELAVGESLSVQVSTRLNGLAEPPEEDGTYDFEILARSNEAPPSRSIVSATIGTDSDSKLTFHVVNIFFGFDPSTLSSGADGVNIPPEYVDGVAGATITLQRDDVVPPDPSVPWTPTIFSGTTESDGKHAFESLPAGRYRVTVRAPKHEPYTGMVYVRPGLEHFEIIPLNFGAVTIEWDVREITIEDRYEVTIETIFETAVPAPVIVITPAAVSLPAMCEGDVYEVELFIENKGILAALDFKNPIPNSDAFLRVEPITELPANFDIPAQQTVRVAYRYIALQPLPNSPCE